MAPPLTLHKAVVALEAAVGKKRGVLSLSALDLATGTTIIERDPHRALNPASNAKLVTMALALEWLGPDFRFESGLWLDTSDAKGTPALTLHSEGDPSLVAADLEALAGSLEDEGIKRVGEIRVDQSTVGEAFVPPGFAAKPGEWATFRAPISAVSVDGNTMTLIVRGGRAAGDEATVEVHPRTATHLESQVRTGASGSSEALELTLSRKDSGTRALLKGTIPTGATARLSRRLDDPRLIPGESLRDTLVALGIQVDGPVRLGGPPDGLPLASMRSAPLRSLLPALGKQSDNFAAEMLFRVVGERALTQAYRGSAPSVQPERRALARPSAVDTAPGADVERGSGPGAGASWAAAAQSAEELLIRWGAFEPGDVMRNGSGLYDGARLSSATLTRLLRHAWTHQELREPLVEALAIGGVDGTLRHRFEHWSASRAIRAKTGTLDRSVALSGYVLSPDNRPPLAFSLLVELGEGGAATLRPDLDRVIDALAAERWPEPATAQANATPALTGDGERKNHRRSVRH